MEAPKLITIALYNLYHLDTLPSPPVGVKELERMRIAHGYERIERLMDALEWAAANPSYPFASMLPYLEFSDSECYIHLMRWRDQLREYMSTHPPSAECTDNKGAS
jgi:hypothetical protein